MKILLLSMLILITNCVSAQNLSEDCFPFDHDRLGKEDFELPLVMPNSSITISRTKTLMTDEKTIIFKTETRNCKVRNGLLISFSDSSTLRFDNLELECNKIDDNFNSLTGSLVINDEMYSKLSKLDVLEFKLGEILVPVIYKDRESLPHVVRCLFK